MFQISRRFDSEFARHAKNVREERRLFGMLKKKAKSPSKVSAENGEQAIPSPDYSGELTEGRWSVVTFEKRVARGLAYDQAVRKMEKLGRENQYGLCILTDESAARISKRKKQ